MQIDRRRSVYRSASYVIGDHHCLYRGTGHVITVAGVVSWCVRRLGPPADRHSSIARWNYQSLNNSFNVLASGQAKRGHVVLVNGKRHRGATNLPFAFFGIHQRVSSLLSFPANLCTQTAFLFFRLCGAGASTAAVSTVVTRALGHRSAGLPVKAL